MRSICAQINLYYDYKGRYEFTLAPLNYYKRKKIKFNLRYHGYLDELHELNKLDNCRVIKIGNVSITKYIKGLHLNGNQLTKLPSIICNFKSLKYLYIYNNQITSLPSWICKLKSLTYLSLHDNQLTSLPSSLYDLKSLEYLYIYNNQLTELSSLVGNLKMLKVIYLYNNKLTNMQVSHIRGLLPNCSVR